MHPRAPAVAGRSIAAPVPTTRLVINVAASQAAWFAAVISAAEGQPDLGLLPAVVAIAWHLWLSEDRGREALLVGLVALLGLGAETIVLSMGHVAYAPGRWFSALPPAWLVMLWAVFATNLNVTLRWLHGRPWLAAACGALAGPLAFASGVRLGGATFVDPAAALVTLAVEWALMTPLLVAMAMRLDGVRPPLGRRKPRHA